MSNEIGKVAEGDSPSGRKRQIAVNGAQSALDRVVLALGNIELFSGKDVLLEAIQQRYPELRAVPPTKIFDPEKLSAYAVRCLGCTLEQSYDVEEIERRQQELAKEIAAREGSVGDENAEDGHGDDMNAEEEPSLPDDRPATGKWKEKKIV